MSRGWDLSSYPAIRYIPKRFNGRAYLYTVIRFQITNGIYFELLVESPHTASRLFNSCEYCRDDAPAAGRKRFLPRVPFPKSPSTVLRSSNLFAGWRTLRLCRSASPRRSLFDLMGVFPNLTLILYNIFLIFASKRIIGDRRGFEPLYYPVNRVRSNQLSYPPPISSLHIYYIIIFLFFQLRISHCSYDKKSIVKSLNYFNRFWINFNTENINLFFV